MARLKALSTDVAVLQFGGKAVTHGADKWIQIPATM